MLNQKNNMNDTVKDLFDLKNRQINKLQEDLHQAQNQITQLETYIFELCDKDCPAVYKEVIKKEVFKHLKIYNG
jgi:uncharacterized protein YutD